MKKIKFAFGIHCHQPVGNFDFVFEEAYHNAYQPFLNIMERYPDFKINIHYTGILLEWIQLHFPEHIDQLGKMVSRGQAEIMGGGFYEPILSSLPERDAIGQINLLTAWIKEQLGVNPRGMWLAERVWEPTHPTTMTKANMEYTVIDDSHFKYSGLKNQDLLGYYITEDIGNDVRIFPISQKLRYTIPFQDPQVTLDYLKGIASEDERLIVFADDGEKFGVWPGTHELVFKKGWLEKFLKLICDNQHWIEIVHFAEAIDTIKALGRIYLPTASYAEMMHWALFPKAFQEYEDFEHYLKQENLLETYGIYIRGGFWRNFLSKYSEANQLHKKMLYVSNLVWKQENKIKESSFKKALKHIWASQCNCPYWHGVFGGLYLGHLRHAVYQEMMKAEKILRQNYATPPTGKIIELDYNLDGSKELICETSTLNIYLEPDYGGRITELDFLPREFNLLNTMTRREEGYHRKLKKNPETRTPPENSDHSDDSVASIHDLVLTKEEGLDRFLHYDFYERKSLIDHFLAEETTLDKFQAATYKELGDFYNSSYQVIRKKINLDFSVIEMKRMGNLFIKDASLPVQVNKKLEISLIKPELIISYRLKNRSNFPIPIWFGIEFNFGLLAGYADDRYFVADGLELNPNNLASSGELEGRHQIGLIDEYNNLKIDLCSSKPALLWRFPIETISQSESGFERVYQSSTLLFSYKIELNKTWDVKIHKIIGAIK
jgi:alpha-amylase/alpha-mannosidase (GH57 family)